MKTISKENYERIDKISYELGQLLKGCNNQKVEREYQKIALFEKYSKENGKILEIGKVYNIVYTKTENITSSRKWAKYIKVIDSLEKMKYTGETSHFYNFENEYYAKKVLKDNFLGIIKGEK